MQNLVFFILSTTGLFYTGVKPHTGICTNSSKFYLNTYSTGRKDYGTANSVEYKAFARNDSISGKWCAGSSDLFRDLTFSKNGSLVISARSDTILRLTYTVMSNNYLLLKDANQQYYLNKIEKLSLDSLVIRDLLFEKGRLTFYKCGKK